METTDYVDVELRDHVRRNMSVEDPEGVIHNQEIVGFLSEELEEGIMSKLQEHLGDGEAKVVVGADLALSDYGNKAGAFCSVSVACNNNLEDIQAVHDIIHPYVRQQVEQDLLEVEAIRARVMGGAKEAPVKTAKPATAKAKKRPQAGKAPKKGRTSLKKPSFRK